MNIELGNVASWVSACVNLFIGLFAFYATRKNSKQQLAIQEKIANDNIKLQKELAERQALDSAAQQDKANKLEFYKARYSALEKLHSEIKLLPRIPLSVLYGSKPNKPRNSNTPTKTISRTDSFITQVGEAIDRMGHLVKTRRTHFDPDLFTRFMSHYVKLTENFDNLKECIAAEKKNLGAADQNNNEDDGELRPIIRFHYGVLFHFSNCESTIAWQLNSVKKRLNPEEEIDNYSDIAIAELEFAGRLAQIEAIQSKSTVPTAS